MSASNATPKRSKREHTKNSLGRFIERDSSGELDSFSSSKKRKHQPCDGVVIFKRNCINQASTSELVSTSKISLLNPNEDYPPEFLFDEMDFNFDDESIEEESISSFLADCGFYPNDMFTPECDKIALQSPIDQIPLCNSPW